MPSRGGTATGGGLCPAELPGRFVDRGGGAGLALADRGGLSLMLLDVPDRKGDALGGGDLVRLGSGDAKGTGRTGAESGGVLLPYVGIVDDKGVRIFGRAGMGGIWVWDGGNIPVAGVGV